MSLADDTLSVEQIANKLCDERTFLVTLLSFAVSLLLGILGLVIAARLQSAQLNLTTAYRHIALPVAAVVGVIALITASVMEIRQYRQTKALVEIERISS